MSSRTRKMTAHDLSLEFAVGAFFFAALAILGVFTILLSSRSFFGERQTLEVWFPDVAGLGKGDQVLVSGVKIGTVDSLELVSPGTPTPRLRGGGGVQVGLELRRDIPIYADNTIEVRHSSVLGGRHVVIEPGTKATGEANMGQLTGTAPADLVNEAARMVQTLREEINNIKTELRQGELIPKTVALVDNLKAISDNLRNGKGTVGKLLADDQLYNVVSDSFETLGKAGERVDQTASELNSILADLRAGKGTAGKLLTDQALYDDATAIAADLREGRGTLGKLLTDDTLHAELQQAAEDIGTLVEKAAKGESTLGRFLADDGKLYNSALETSEGLRRAVREIEQGEGTLGLLVKDPELYRQAVETVRAAKAAVKDFREQAPVSTFGSLIFGAM